MQVKRIRSRRAGLALVLALGMSPLGANAAAGLAPAPFRPTSGGGWVDRSGFAELVYRSVLEGYLVGTFAGIALADPQEPSSAARIGLGGVIGSAVGLAVPLLLSTGEVRAGDVVFMGAGQGLGMFNGWLLPLTIQLGGCGAASSTSCGFGTADQVRLDAALSAGLSLAGGGLAVYLGHGLNISPGQAEAMGSAVFWGAVAGALLGNSMISFVDRPSVTLGAMVALANVGFGTAFVMRDFFDMDRSRIWFMDLGVVLGASAGLALAYFISPSFTNNTGVSLALLGGAVAGWAVAYYASSGLDGFKKSAPPEGAAASLGFPTVRPLASMAAGDRAVGVQVDLLQGRF